MVHHAPCENFGGGCEHPSPMGVWIILWQIIITIITIIYYLHHHHMSYCHSGHPWFVLLYRLLTFLASFMKFAIKAENDWWDGRPRVTMQHQLTPFPVFVWMLFYPQKILAAVFFYSRAELVHKNITECNNISNIMSVINNNNSIGMATVALLFSLLQC